MKRFCALLCALLFVLPALAQEGSRFDQPTLYAISLLTEVFGYTQREAEAFDFKVTETDTQWTVKFSPKDHPDWVYTGAFNKADGSFASSTSPFPTHYIRYPGEAGVRDVLEAAAENHWFTQWDEAARTAFREMMVTVNIRASDALQAGLGEKEYPAAQAVQDFFVSCYGETYLWAPTLYQWRDEVLTQNGLTLTLIAVDIASRKGIHTRTTPDASGTWTYDITEFLEEVPQELTQAFSHPKLQGWNGLCGVLWTCQGPAGVPAPQGRGLAVLTKGEERLLVMLYQDYGKREWQVAPVGEKALLPNRDVYITRQGDDLQGGFSIEYPISGFESESFRCEIVFTGDDADPRPMCRLLSYSRINRQAGTGLVIDSNGEQFEAGAYWYHVIAYEPGQPADEQMISAIAPGFLDWTDVSQFPTSADACRQAAQLITLPQEYGTTQGVHLRAKTSSRSADLGIYEPGTLVKVLETLPGDPWPWCHVRVGQVEGYMSSIYVAYGDAANVAGRVSMGVPLRVARAKQDCWLKKGTGWLDGKVMDLPAGTQMHVMAVCGDWLHVMIPRGENRLDDGCERDRRLCTGFRGRPGRHTGSIGLDGIEGIHFGRKEATASRSGFFTYTRAPVR